MMERDLRYKLKKIKDSFKEEIVKVNNIDQLENIKICFLGRKSELVAFLKGLKNLTVEQKKQFGSMANNLRVELTAKIEKLKVKLEDEKIASGEWIDVTRPGIKPKTGSGNILLKVQKEIEKIFSQIGFEIYDGPEIETEWFNFSALNVPADHPARDMQDTFWLINQEELNEKERILPRTQTSNSQVRYMMENKPPFRIIVPGRIFRNEATDATHQHTFHQFEALVVGEEVSVANFKSVAKEFFSEFFDKELNVRLRPSYFPFTEPSFEFDIECTVCGGSGCRSCKNSGWLEVGGAGMVNQRVFESAGYQKDKYQGFAWGFGIERLAMMKYKIEDIRLFMEGDLRFNNQF